MALFSIVTVTLNPPAEDLRKTVESVLAQRIEDWELLVKDGGSTRCIDEELPDDSRIRFVNQSDTGIFDAMNQALAQVQGDYVCFLNAGDVFYDGEALAAVAAAADLEPEVDFFYGDVAKPRSRSGFERYPNHLSRAYLFSHMICHQVWFVRRSYYAKTGGYEIEGPLGWNPSGSDCRFLLRMILCDQVEYHRVAKVLVSYQGGGYSENPKQVKAGKIWKDQQRDLSFSPGERFVYQFLWSLRNVAKSLVYDRGVWRIWRFLQQTRRPKES